jgi:hypothetical protein
MNKQHKCCRGIGDDGRGIPETAVALHDSGCTSRHSGCARGEPASGSTRRLGGAATLLRMDSGQQAQGGDGGASYELRAEAGGVGARGSYVGFCREKSK